MTVPGSVTCLETEIFEHIITTHIVSRRTVHRLHLLDQPQAGTTGPPTLKPTLLERVLLVLLLWVWLRVLQLLWCVRVRPFLLSWLSSLWVQFPCDWL